LLAAAAGWRNVMCPRRLPIWPLLPDPLLPPALTPGLPLSPFLLPQSTAIQIAALKNLSRDMTLYLLDGDGTLSRAGACLLALLCTAVFLCTAGHCRVAGLSPARQCCRADQGHCNANPQILTVLPSLPPCCPAVAKELCKRGYSKVFVVTGGCRAWIAARLRTKQWFGGQALLAENVEAQHQQQQAEDKPVAPPAQLLVKEKMTEELVDA
jgi:hypothetical protein